MRPLAQCDIGTHEDQVTALPVEHARQHRGGQPVGADQVDLQLRVELVGGDLGELAEVGVAGAGHQHLDVTERVDRLCNKGFHRVRVGDVEVESDRLAAFGIDLADDVVELLDPARTQGDREAVRGEFDGGGLSDAGGGAGDDCRPTFGQGVEAGHLGDLQGHRQVCEPAHVTGMDTDRIGLVDLVTLDSFEQFGERHPGLHPGQVGAQAEVCAAAETQEFRTDFAPDHEVVGIVECPLVAVPEPGSSSRMSPSGIVVSYRVSSPATVRARIWLEVS